MGWGRRLTGAAISLSVASVALAQPTGSPNFVPVSMPETNPAPASVVVEPGDHLWRISEEHLATVLGRPAEDSEVDPYWRSVIAANHEQLLSGDPDLIFPGETVALPPTG
jgi:nucleoid-associated protein YgaU